MRVVFLGTPEIAVPSLKALVAGSYEVCAVFTQPDRASGRGQHLRPSAVKAWAQSAGLPVFQPQKIKTDDNRAVLETIRPDFIVVVAYGQILPAWLLEIPRVAPVNVHFSLLPRYRGAAPVAWAVANGDSAAGVTTMIIQVQLDSGPILIQREVPIAETITAGELSRVLAEEGARLLPPTLEGLANGTLAPVPQQENLVTWAPRITKEMALISWNRTAREIHNRIRAFNPWPVAYTEFRGRKLQIFRSLPVAMESPEVPGTLIATSESGLHVACGQKTVLELLEVQLPGKSRISGHAFANGARLQPRTLIFK